MSSKSKRLKFLDGYIEGPFAHGPFTTETLRESEYFMQYIHPSKLHRVALRTPVGYRITYGFSEDVWNNELGIKIVDNEDMSKEVSFAARNYLKTRSWFLEMEKLTAFSREQGEAILLLYTADVNGMPDWDSMEDPVDMDEEILMVEAFNRCDYDILLWDDYGEPELYNITYKRTGLMRAGKSTVRVHGSRILRFVDKNIYERETGHAILAVCYDPLVILSNIIKGAGEAAYRWGTGHPLVLTKDLNDDASVQKMRQMIGTPTRRSWHILPSEYIDSFTMIGQAGQMLNLKSLADMVIDQVVAATGIPRPILLGEVAGVVTGSEVNERSYFALLDKSHTDLEPFVRGYFERDINMRKLLYPYEGYDIDWGLREVLSKEDAADLRQKEISNALALLSIITIDEARHEVGYAPIGPEAGGDVIMGLMSMYAPEMTSYEQQAQGTQKSATSTQTDLDKTKHDSWNEFDVIKDSIESLRGKMSFPELSERMGIAPKTLYKIMESL